MVLLGQPGFWDTSLSLMPALQATLTERMGVITYHDLPPASALPNVSQAYLLA